MTTGDLVSSILPALVSVVAGLVMRLRRPERALKRYDLTRIDDPALLSHYLSSLLFAIGLLIALRGVILYALRDEAALAHGASITFAILGTAAALAVPLTVRRFLKPVRRDGKR